MATDLYWAVSAAGSLVLAGAAVVATQYLASRREVLLKSRIRRLERRVAIAAHHRQGQQAVLEAVSEDLGVARARARAAKEALGPHYPPLRRALRTIGEHAARASELAEAADHETPSQTSSVDIGLELRASAERLGITLELSGLSHTVILPAYDLTHCALRALRTWARPDETVSLHLEPRFGCCLLTFRRPGQTASLPASPATKLDLAVANQWALGFGGRVSWGETLQIEVPVVARRVGPTTHYEPSGILATGGA